jgi:16S rRNA (guanine(966)-N(2))-methyltransferase RsmD
VYQLRIIGGKYKGRKLAAFRGQSVRPTSDRVRESLFNILSVEWEGKAVLDLFAGTGGLGIEAISRGACRVVFIENHIPAIRTLEKNIVAFNLTGCCEVLQYSVEKGLFLLRKANRNFDVIFLDPPYNEGLADTALSLLGSSDILNTDSVIVVEHHCKEELSAEYYKLYRSDQRTYGKTRLSFFVSKPPTR